VLVTIAACNAAGREFNMITVMFPTILGVLGISQSMHLLIAYGRKRAEGFEARRAASGAVREILYPCFFMSVTTATGFLSLLLSDVAPVRELGLYTACGILFCFLVNILLGPALLLIRREGLHVHVPVQTGRLKRWVGGAVRQRRWVLGFAFVLAAASIFSATHIGVETNALKFLRKSNPLIGEFNFIQENLVGLSSLEIDLARDEDESLAGCLEKIATFSRAMGKRFPEERVLSVGDFLKAAVFHVSTPMDAARELDLDALRKRAEEVFENTTPKAAAVFLPALRGLSDVSAYITDDASRLRISVLSPVFDGSRFMPFKEEVGKIASAVFGDAARITGIVPLMVTMQQYLIESQLRCMGLALVLIFIFMVLAARSFTVGLIAMAPNVFPVIVNFGVMGLVGIRLDAATMMIASLSLGIAVDNTIHMVVAFKTLKGKGEDTRTAVDKAVQWKGRPILYTTLVTCSGFLVLIFSGFLPMAWFGGLMAHTVFWAMLGNLVILPALLAGQPE
jgi:predicted RND superfamily exporter protein